MAEPHAYDMIVIGAGPAGVNAALTASMFGKKVAIIERSSVVGGAGANTGTLPSKTLRETALALSGLRSRRLYGVDLSLRREATVADLMSHERVVKSSEQTQILGRLDRGAVSLIHGSACFLDCHTVKVEIPGKQPDLTLSAETFVIAIGSTPSRPDLFPFDHPRVLDSDEVVELPEIPKSLAVVGAGVIGSEYACTFATLGCKVSVIDGRDTLLPFLDWQISQALTNAMVDLGIDFHWQERVAECHVPESDAQNLRLTLTSGKVIEVDAVLVAAGRESRTADLNPDAVGLLLGKRGLIPVNEHFQTNVPHVYAVGDVIGFPALASTSAEQGRVAACHACGSAVLTGMPPLLPSGIYTIPEAAMVGETEGSLKSHGIPYVIGRGDYAENARGKIIGDTKGFLKLLFRWDDMKLVGVHVIGEQATEMVHIGLMVMRAGGGPEMLMHTCFNYPTLGWMYKWAAFDAVITRFGSLDAVPVPVPAVERRK